MWSKIWQKNEVPNSVPGAKLRSGDSISWPWPKTRHFDYITWHAQKCIVLIIQAISHSVLTEIYSPKKGVREGDREVLKDFHPTPLQHAEQPTIRRSCRVDPNYAFPECRPVRLCRTRASLFPQSEIGRRDSAEQHEHASDDVRHRRNVQRRRLLVRLLGDEPQ